MKATYYKQTNGTSLGFYALLGGFGALILIALSSFYYVGANGHYITGMTNQVVWGLPHVFALFLIVAASGALNVASISSVFGKKAYKPLARMSAVLSITLLAGGLIVLLLDLGRADRLIIAMTYYNFKSIFAWNIILYSGFFALVGAYLWVMMDNSVRQYTRVAGFAAFTWRLMLTTGTGSIFGFLVARQAFDAAILAPMFVVMSFSFGLAIFLIVLVASYKWTERPLGDAIVLRLTKLLGVFVAGVFYFVLAHNLTNLYGTENHEVLKFLLLGQNGGGVYAGLFWIGQLLIGTAIPLALLLLPKFNTNRSLIITACILVIMGGFIQIYVLLIGGQAFPLEIFPGKEVIASSFFDGVSNSYTPSIWELMLGVGGIGIAFGLFTFAATALAILPVSLADKDVDPKQAA